MSRLQTLSDYRREIAELDALLADMADAADNSFAVQLSADGLRARRTELSEELEHLTDEELPGHELQVILGGSPVVHNAIDAEFLSALLQRIQRIVRSAVNAAAGGHRIGRFARVVERRGRLRFAESFAGSFGMRLEAVEEQLELDGTSAIAPTFDAFVRVLSHTRADAQMLADLAPLGPRATEHLRSLFSELRKANAAMTVVWPSIKGVREAGIAADVAARLEDELGRVRGRQIGRTVRGILDGAIHQRGQFLFVADDGEVFEGKISPDILEDHRDFFLAPCKAWIVTSILENDATGETSESHRLLELSGLDDPDFPQELPEDEDEDDE